MFAKIIRQLYYVIYKIDVRNIYSGKIFIISIILLEIVIGMILVNSLITVIYMNIYENVNSFIKLDMNIVWKCKFNFFVIYL